MAGKFVSTSREGRIATVRFDRGNKANALSFEVIAELTDAAFALDADADISAVILTGAAGLFTLGFDLKDPETHALTEVGLAEQRQRLRAGRRMCAAWTGLEPITIVAIEGWCIGGGVALAVACDFRVVAEGATLYTPEIERGMNMSWGSVPRITALLGPAKAKRIIVLAERIAAAQAVNWGLADELAPKGKAVEAATRMAQRIAALPPVAVRMCKQAIELAAHPLAEAVSAMDRDQFALIQRGEDFHEAVQAYLEKRDPDFTGR
ncbi:MAG: enoyl-CoA hydratase/isomerase family protein [Alphaproteobacteria bacterium]|nr:enoyl-CoA hydratase/isomerase family protein [Alphaproteobacteria bacterium]